MPSYGLTCAGCGGQMVKVARSLPQGQAMCQPCRRARPTPQRRQMRPKPERRRHRALALLPQACECCDAEFSPRQPNQRFCSRVCVGQSRWSRRPCEVCGEPFRAKMAEQRTCGRWCGYFVQRGRWPSSRVPQPREPKSPRPPVEPKPSSQRVFIRDCVVCGRVFVTPHTTLTCSGNCHEAKRLADRRESKHRRRARKRSAFVAPVWRLTIYERDHWRCGICGRAVRRDAVVPHPLAPTLDHIVPLSKGGTHEPANVRTAHFLCNATRGDRGTDEQLALVG